MCIMDRGDGLKVTATDVSSRCGMISLIGPEAEVVLKELAEVRGARRCKHATITTPMMITMILCEDNLIT